MRILALDIGDRRVGLAISDPSELIASPLPVLRRQSLKVDFAALSKLIAEREVQAVVAGVPYRLDGGLSQQTEKTIKFIEALEKHLGQPLIRYDERLTTAAVERQMIEGGASRKKRRATIDSVAAAYLLQNYLDFQRRPAAEQGS